MLKYTLIIALMQLSAASNAATVNMVESHFYSCKGTSHNVAGINRVAEIFPMEISTDTNSVRLGGVFEGFYSITTDTTYRLVVATGRPRASDLADYGFVLNLNRFTGGLIVMTPEEEGQSPAYLQALCTVVEP